MPQLPYDNTQVKEDDWRQVPPGQYLAQVRGSAEHSNAHGTGAYIRVQFRIVAGPYKDSIIGNTYNHVHANTEAERIGRQQLKALGVVCGVPNMQATEEIHGKNVSIKVVANGTYSDIAAVWKPEAVGPTANPNGSTDQADADTGGTRAPWDA